MTPERWEQVEHLYHAAVELESGQRAAFLAKACAGDEELRREVESLLAYENETAGFIRKPALEVVARELADEPALSTRTIDHFQILTRRISENLRLRLTGEEQKRLVKRYTENAEAYQFYLRGRYHWNKRSVESVKKAVVYFNQATDVDPNYAPAYSGLADCYNTLNEYGAFPIKVGFQRTKAAALKALELDDTLAEAHASLAFIRLNFDWDWVGAEQSFERAIQLNPNYATARQWYGVYLIAQGRFDAGIAETERALQLEPLVVNINSQLARALYFARRYDQSIEQCKRTLDLDPNFASAHIFLGQAYLQKGMRAEAIAALQQARTLSGDRPEAIAALGHAYAVSGRRSDAMEIVERLQSGPKRSDFSYRLAMIHSGFGETALAIEMLEKAYEESDVMMALRLKVDPVFDGLRSDPRFIDLLRRVGFSP